MERTKLSSLRRYLLTGIVVSAPIGVTAFVLYWIFVRVDAILGRLFGTILGRWIPGLGFLTLLLVVIAIGWVAQQALGGRLISMGKRWLTRFPLTRTVYTATSQIVESLVIEKERFFRNCVLVEYPRAGVWALGFRTASAPAEVNELTAEDLVAVFVPTAPNPTSGVLIFVPRSQVKPLAMSIEDGFKLVLSGGVVIPGQKSVKVGQRVGAGTELRPSGGR